ncbi:MAG TPA: hypothetical protein VFN02_14900 [Ktedonobacteraceae bacterium]|nr:hypothetical protein [Ktedonobacteraceae bacterium]
MTTHVGAAGGHKAASGLSGLSGLAQLPACPEGTPLLYEVLAGGAGRPAGRRAELGNTACQEYR